MILCAIPVHAQQFGRLDLFAIGEGGALYHQWGDGANFGPSQNTWEPHPALPNGHKIVAPPGVASWGPNRLDVLVTGDDGLVYHRYWAGGPTYGPQNGGWEAHPALPGGHRVAGSPSVTTWGPDRLDIFVTGDDGLVYHRYWANGYGPPDGWERHAGIKAEGPPRVVAWSSNRLDIFVTGSDGGLRHQWWNGTRYGMGLDVWESHPKLPDGHRIVSMASVTTWGADRLDIFVTADDGTIYHRFWDDGYWPAADKWEAHGGLKAVGQPVSVSWDKPGSGTRLVGMIKVSETHFIFPPHAKGTVFDSYNIKGKLHYSISGGSLNAWWVRHGIEPWNWGSIDRLGVRSGNGILDIPGDIHDALRMENTSDRRVELRISANPADIKPSQTIKVDNPLDK